MQRKGGRDRKEIDADERMPWIRQEIVVEERVRQKGKEIYVEEKLDGFKRKMMPRTQ